MSRFSRAVAVVGLTALAAGPAIAGEATSNRLDASQLVRVMGDEALARGPGGTLTRDAAEAFVEALEFTLAEVGQPTSFGPDQRARMHQALAAGFGGMTLDDQLVLANFRNIWTATHLNWATLPLENRREFARAVLTAAFGEGGADQALGPAGGGGGTFEGGVGDFCGRHGCGSAADQLNSYVPSYD